MHVFVESESESESYVRMCLFLLSRCCASPSHHHLHQDPTRNTGWLITASPYPRCLGEGDDPILPTHVTAQWDQAFHQLNAKLQQLNARVVKLDEWKFNTVEEMHRRLGQLLMLRFPADVSKSINEMKHGLSEALEKKMAALSKDVEAALSRADYLTIDLIFQEVKSAKDDDSNFINNTTYNMLIGILENYLNDLVESIKILYMGFDVKEAHLRQEHLWKLEKVRVMTRPLRQLQNTV